MYILIAFIQLDSEILPPLCSQ